MTTACMKKKAFWMHKYNSGDSLTGWLTRAVDRNIFQGYTLKISQGGGGDETWKCED